MSSMAERIKEAREENGLNKSEFARRVGVSAPTVLDWENGTITSIKTTNLLKACQALNRTPGWVLHGKEPRKLPPGTSYRNLTSMLSHSENLRENKSGYHEDPRSLGKIPLISSVQAGAAELAVDNLAPGDAERWLPPPPVSHSRSTYALTVEGDSMDAPYGKSYPPGSIIYVDPEQRGHVTIGDPIIAKINGIDAVTFKAFAQDGDRAFLKPLNPQYPTIMDEFRVLGVVIGKWES